MWRQELRMSVFASSRETKLQVQQCIHCGKQIRRNLKQCPHCREAQAEQRPAATPRPRQTNAPGHFRHGLLLILLSGVIHYVAGGYSPLVLPDNISSPLLTYLAPVLFVGGAFLILWGFFLRMRA
jgi:hypothetical protein